MTTRYPNAIDSYGQIKIVRNRIDEITQTDHNDLRSAVIAIEQTLGILPQGPFGTVVDRMDDAYQNIEYHAAGYAPRHHDTVIDSIARSGTRYSLTQGTVGSQIEELLSTLNNLIYLGSTPKTFADGYALPSSYIDSAISQIIAQVGGTTGSTKIGAAGFTAGDSGQYILSGTDVDAQAKELGDFIDEGGRFRSKIFDAFITEGFSIAASGSGTTIAVGYGHLASNGRYLRYSGANVSVSAGTTNYLYAKISAGSVSVSITTTVATAVGTQGSSNVLLYIIVHDGANWTSTDIRRFGMFANNKNAFTVGNALGGSDGYGYDFGSINAALGYISTLASGGTRNYPKKILLSTDITVTSTTTISINDLEIDGAGHRITLTADVPIFTINADYIKIHNIVAMANVSPTNACFAAIGSTASRAGIYINNCLLSSLTGQYAPYFLMCGEVTGANKVKRSVFTNNIAYVTSSAINLVKPYATAASVIEDTIISNNIFMNMLTGGSVSSNTCIRVGSNCVVSDNIIEVNKIYSPYEGAFYAGIELEYAFNCVVSNNFVNGGTSIGNTPGTALMPYGIRGRCSGTVTSIHVISGNIVKGILTAGIDFITNGTMIDAMVVGNYIDNIYDFSTSLTSIRAHNSIGNMISRPGVYAIQAASKAIGNFIFGNDSHYTMTAAILCTTGSNKMISNNCINDCSGIGIDVNSTTSSSVCNNIISGISSVSTIGITNIGNECRIGHNLIKNYLTYGIICISAQNSVLIFNNSVIDCDGIGIELYNATKTLVYNNILHSIGSGSTVAINRFSSYCEINGNFIYNYGASSNNIIISSTSTSYATAVINNLIANPYSTHDGYSIKLYSSLTESNVSNNTLYRPYHGINFFGATSVVCSNNSIYGNSAATRSAIINIGGTSVISGNNIVNCCVNPTSDSAIKVNSGATIINICNNIIVNCNGTGINGNSGTNLVISNNFLYGGTSAGTGITGVGINSFISDNLITLYGSYSGLGVVHYGINVTGAGRIAINNNFIRSPGAYMITGINLAYSTSSYYTIINNIIGNGVNTMLASGAIGINVNNSTNSIISGNMMAGIQSGTSAAYAIKDVGNYCVVSGNYSKNANYGGILIKGTATIVSNNYIYSSYYYGIYISGTARCLVNGNYIISSLSKGIAIGTSNNSVACNNFISGSASTGVAAELSDFCKIFNNMIQSAGTDSIYLDTCFSAAVENNYLYLTTDDAIVLSISPYSSINGNHMNDTGNYGISLISDAYSSCIGNYVYNANIGINISGTGTNVTGNVIRTVANGIGIDSFAYAYSLVGNSVIRHTATAYSLGSTRKFIAVGNSNIPYGSATGNHGMELSSTKYAVIVGNRCKAGSGSGSEAFNGSSVTNNVMMANLSDGAATGFGTGFPALSTYNVKY